MHQGSKEHLGRQCTKARESVPLRLQQSVASQVEKVQQSASDLSHALWQRQGYQGKLAAMGCLSQGPMQKGGRYGDVSVQAITWQGAFPEDLNFPEADVRVQIARAFLLLCSLKSDQDTLRGWNY